MSVLIPIPKTTRIVTDSGPRRAIQSDEGAIPGGHVPGFGAYVSANGIYRGHDVTGLVEPDTIWININDTATFSLLARLEKPLGSDNSRIYSKQAFLYPEAKWQAVFTTLVATPNNNHYLGLENGGSSPQGLHIFFHRYQAGADQIMCGGTGFLMDVTALVAAIAPNWLTAPHWYEVKCNPLSIDYFVDGVLVCSALADKDMNGIRQQTGAYATFSTSSGANRGFVPNYAEFIAIEGSVLEGPVYFPVSKIFHGCAECDPQKPRHYLLATINPLAAASISTLANCLPLFGGSSFALTIALTYNALAVMGARIHIKSGYDGLNYDSVIAGQNNVGDLDRWDMDSSPGNTVRQTKFYGNSGAKITKVLVENLDPARTIANITIRAQVKG